MISHGLSHTPPERTEDILVRFEMTKEQADRHALDLDELGYGPARRQMAPGDRLQVKHRFSAHYHNVLRALAAVDRIASDPDGAEDVQCEEVNHGFSLIQDVFVNIERLATRLFRKGK